MTKTSSAIRKKPDPVSTRIIKMVTSSDTVKDVGIAIGSVVVVFLLTFDYSGNWPPMVVI